VNYRKRYYGVNPKREATTGKGGPDTREVRIYPLQKSSLVPYEHLLLGTEGTFRPERVEQIVRAIGT
jgi:hypothetical protein